MSKQLSGLSYDHSWVMMLSCAKGCLDYLRFEVSMPWLFGCTGHAFVLNIHEEVCPSGPTAWQYGPVITELPRNVGYSLTGVHGMVCRGDDMDAKRAEAWDFVRGSIDEDVPCYGWELDFPDFSLISGYDDTGYISVPYEGATPGHKPWQELGASQIGMLEVNAVRLCAPQPEIVGVREGLRFALHVATNPSCVIFDKYASGVRAFEVWAEALEAGRANRFGQGYNAAFWADCRARGVDFLTEAKARLAGAADNLFDEAAERFAVVRDKLKAVSAMHPFSMADHGEPPVTSPEAAALIREAGSAEGEGLSVLQQIVDTLQGDARHN